MKKYWNLESAVFHPLGTQSQIVAWLFEMSEWNFCCKVSLGNSQGVDRDLIHELSWSQAIAMVMRMVSNPRPSGYDLEQAWVRLQRIAPHPRIERR